MRTIYVTKIDEQYLKLQMTEGVAQGDPNSQSLFVMAYEDFGQQIDEIRADKINMDFNIPKYLLPNAEWNKLDTISMHQHTYIDDHAEIHHSRPNRNPTANNPNSRHTNTMGNGYQHGQVICAGQTTRKRMQKEAQKHGQQNITGKVREHKCSRVKQIPGSLHYARRQTEQRNHQQNQPSSNGNEPGPQSMAEPRTIHR